jgi:shugoshin
VRLPFSFVYISNPHINNHSLNHPGQQQRNMARKSIDFSQSLLQFQSQARSRNERQNRASLPNINYGGNTNRSHNNTANRPINTTRIEQSTESCSNNKVSPYASNNHNSYNESEVELIRTKYILQNKSLARSNSVMLAKINEMETTVGDLINENMRLRKSSNNNGLKGHLEEKMDLIESNIVEKVNEIFQYLKGIREKEGLMMNPQLDILNTINRPITSTPIDNERYFPSFNFSFGREREVDGEVREVSPRVNCTNEDRELETSTSFNMGQAKSNSPEISIDQTFIEESSVNNRRADKFSTIIEEKEPSDSSKEMESIQEMLPKNTEKQHTVLQKKDLLENNIEPNILPLETGKGVVEKHSVPKIIDISDNDTDKKLESKRIRSKNTGNECLGSEPSNPSQFQKVSKESRAIGTELTPELQNAPKTHQSTDLTSIPKISESTLGEKKIQTSSKANSEEPEEISRPRRTRNVVDYKGISLRAKMRRESAGFVDAVGENAMVNYGVVSRKTETPDNKRNSSREIEPLKITQRKPLGNVTNTSQPKRLKLDKKEPIEVFKDATDQENEALSVFDFEDETKTRRESVYIGKRTAKRNRRHTLMM